MKKKHYISIVFFIALSTFSCSDLLDSAIKCAIKSVELEGKVLRGATKGKNYYETITAGVNNDPNDEDYDYLFTVNGKIPDGIQFSSEGNKFILNGTAPETGNFPFELAVSVTFGDDITCSSSARKTYTLVVK